MILTKARPIVTKLTVVFKLSTDNAPPYCLHRSGRLPLTPPLYAIVFFNARSGSAYHLPRLLEQAGLYLLYCTGEPKGDTTKQPGNKLKVCKYFFIENSKVTVLRFQYFLISYTVTEAAFLWTLEYMETSLAKGGRQGTVARRKG